jgi:PAS domain-containing protein
MKMSRSGNAPKKRAEETRNRLTEQLQLILESTGQGLYGIDLQGN